MMGRRLQLQAKFEELLESRNVYYQPPGMIQMKYPAIIYSRSRIESRYADDTSYSLLDEYEIIVISREPDHKVIKELLKLPYCSYDRSYISNNLYHDVLTIYY